MSFENVYAIGNKDERGILELVEISRRAVGPHDVHIKIEYCGICHSDYHHVKNEWGHRPPVFPCVPGHEIVGHVDKIGTAVTKFKIGDRAGVGCLVHTCKKCPECAVGCEQHCTGGFQLTFDAPATDGTGALTYGGYSQAIVVDENYAFTIPTNLDLAACAPLLCAGITTYSPLIRYGVKEGSKLAVLGLGGLGHMAVKFGKALRANVTVLSRSAAKNDVAFKLGADSVLITTDADAFKGAHNSFDFILDTVSGDHDINAYLGLLKMNGTLILVGASPEQLKVNPFNLLMGGRRLVGSLIGGIKETQEMLDFCGKFNITSDIEVIDVAYANKAYERMLKSDVKFRFVLDIGKTLTKESAIEPPLH